MAIAKLDWSLDVTCPNCKEELDLAQLDYDPDNTISQSIFNNKWHALKGYDVQCRKCQHEFVLGDVEY